MFPQRVAAVLPLPVLVRFLCEDRKQLSYERSRLRQEMLFVFFSEHRFQERGSIQPGARRHP